MDLEDLICLSQSTAYARDECIRAATVRSRSILLIGASGVGKETFAEALGRRLGDPITRVPCNANQATIRRILFYSPPGLADTETGQPGLLGEPGSRVLLLQNLEQLTEELWREFANLVSSRRYIDQNSRLWTVPDELTIIGSLKLGSSDVKLDENHFVAQSFERKIRLESLNERREEIQELSAIFLGSLPAQKELDQESLALLLRLDYSEGNLDQLRELLVDASLASKTNVVRLGDLRRALFQSVRAMSAAFEIKGIRLTADALVKWLRQFPHDLQPTALHILGQSRWRYYVTSGLWWNSLRDLYNRVFEEYMDIANVRSRRLFERAVVLSSLQLPGESEGRALADFRKANTIPESVARVRLDELVLAATRLPRDPYVILIDDWMGSGEQMMHALQRHMKVLTEFARVMDRTGRRARFRFLFVWAHTRGVYAVSHFLKQLRIDARLIIGRTLTDEDSCFAPSSRVVRDPSQRDAFHTFSLEVGRRLWSEHPLGWDPGGLLVLFQHTVPNNTLPTIWKSDSSIPWESLTR